MTMTLMRVNRRVWRTNSEKFTDYVEEKLKLMQFLNLSEREQIELLADGVKEPTLRRFVLDTRAVTIPDFIERVRRITENNIPGRRQESGDYRSLARRDGVTNKVCTHYKKSGHLVQDCRIAKLNCLQMRKTGAFEVCVPIQRNGVRSGRSEPTSRGGGSGGEHSFKGGGGQQHLRHREADSIYKRTLC